MVKTWQSGRQKAEVEKRLARVLQVLRLIETEPCAWTRAGLAERFGMSERMLDNDLALLRAVGFDIQRHQGGYEIAQPNGE